MTRLLKYPPHQFLGLNMPFRHHFLGMAAYFGPIFWEWMKIVIMDFKGVW
jgi:hypothetical protein